MSTLKVDSITNNGNPVNFTTDIAVGNGTVKREYYSQADAPSTTTNGAVWWDTTNSVYKMLIEGEWYTVGLIASPPSITGDRALFVAGYDNSADQYLSADYFSISTLGNASVFGDTTQVRAWSCGVSDATYGVFAGGVHVGNGTTYDVIEYYTFATPGNATSFGSLTGFDAFQYSRSAFAGASNGTYGVFAGTGNSVAWHGYVLNIINYVTIATPSNATDFGDLTVAKGGAGGCSDGTYGLFGGGTTSSTEINSIDYITIATPGNATDFGDLTVARGEGVAACSSATIGVFLGGLDTSPVRSNVIDYVTIATPGNATDFGDLDAGIQGGAATSDFSRGVFGGGKDTTGNRSNRIQYFAIDTPGNAADFGDLTDDPEGTSACSGN